MPSDRGITVRSNVFFMPPQQLDRDALRPAQKADPQSGTDSARLHGEFGALAFQLRRYRVDVAYGEPEMIEPLVGSDRRRMHAIAERDRHDEDIGAAEFQIDARLALHRGTDHLRAQHALEPRGGRLRIGAPQVDVVP